MGAGLVGFVTAFILLVEKVALLEDPAYVPTCSINPILSCGSVMTTDQAEAFGFPNPIIGVAAFPVVTTSASRCWPGPAAVDGTGSACRRARRSAWSFIHHLIFQSLYRIDALCPYCMIVWVVAIPLFRFATLHNVRVGHLPTPAPLRPLTQVVDDYRGVVLTGWYLVIGGLIPERFWDYWVTLIT